MRKMDDETRHYLLMDEMPRVWSCLNAAVDNAEERGVNYYGVLSPHFYYVVRGGIIETAIDRSAGTATRIYIRKWLARFKVLEPRDEYSCL